MFLAAKRMAMPVAFAALFLTACLAASIPSIGRADEALDLLDRYGCHTCHVIPGAAQPQGVTGPPLDAMAAQPYVAGVVPNTAEALTTFIEDPQRVDPRSAMPDLGVSHEQAQIIASYLRGTDPGR